MEAFWDGFEKRAAESDEPSWWEKQKGAARAQADGEKGIKKYVVSEEHYKKRLKGSLLGGLKGGAVGGAGGAALGGLAGALHSGRKGALAGAALGGLGGLFVGEGVGSGHGQWKVDKEHLKSKGIEGDWLGRHKFSPEAKAKYIDAYKKK